MMARQPRYAKLCHICEKEMYCRISRIRYHASKVSLRGLCSTEIAALKVKQEGMKGAGPLSNLRHERVPILVGRQVQQCRGGAALAVLTVLHNVLQACEGCEVAIGGLRARWLTAKGPAWAWLCLVLVVLRSFRRHAEDLAHTVKGDRPGSGTHGSIDTSAKGALGKVIGVGSSVVRLRAVLRILSSSFVLTTTEE